MSRIGKSPVPLPSGVEIKVDGSDVSVKGAKGTLERSFDSRISFSVGEGNVDVVRADDQRETRALHGLSRALLNNMVLGVSEGYRKDLEMVGVGYRASLKGKTIELLVGFSHPVNVEAPDGIVFEVPENTKISVIGIDKQLVGQVAADIRKVRPPEPYKGKGIRYAGEHVRRKAGKAGVTA
ncbi:MAG: 50S ribosomal protein L6 [Actinomycetota bacterium]|nr:50S ribosomal protein L6 [Actinomycetota bacterium]